MYPEGGYKVIGEVIEKPGKNKDLAIYNEEGKPLFIQPLKTYKKLLYKRLGYIWSEEHQGYILIKKNNWLLLLFSLVGLTLLIGGLLWTFMNMKNGPDIDPGAGDYTSQYTRPADMDENRILIPGYNDWIMEANTDEVYIALFNPEKNPCFFQFDIVLESTGETLFSTKLEPPGKAVTTVKLPRKFKEGTYPITVKISSHSLDDTEEKLNGGEVKTKIIALTPEE